MQSPEPTLISLTRRMTEVGLPWICQNPDCKHASMLHFEETGKCYETGCKCEKFDFGEARVEGIIIIDEIGFNLDDEQIKKTVAERLRQLRLDNAVVFSGFGTTSHLPSRKGDSEK